MKKLFILLLFTFILMIQGCNADKTYSGKWYGLTAGGEKVDINIEGKKMTFSDNSSQEIYPIEQIGKGFENSTSYYMLKSEGNHFNIIFPNKKDKNYAVIINSSDKKNPLYGVLLYTISRNDYPSEFHKLN